MSERQTTGGNSISYTINNGNYAQQGWQCPICKKVLAPFMTYCPFHDTESNRWTATSATGKVGNIE